MSLRRAELRGSPRTRRSRAARGATRSTAASDLEARCVGALARSGHVASEMQREVFRTLAGPRSALIVAPTGSGKTAAALLPILLGVTPGAGVQALVVAPVRALVESLRAAIAALASQAELAVRVVARTGDSSAAARRALLTSPPELVVTTPESLAVLLATSARGALAAVREVVLDEVHLLAAGKRGALLGATLATLDAHVGASGSSAPRRVAMSATATPRDALCRWLGRDVALVETPPQRVSLTIVDPLLEAAYPRASWTWRAALPAVARAVVETEGCTLLFVSSRAGAEQWSLALRDVLPSRVGVGCYHGSLGREERASVAEGIRDGTLRAVVTTSALEVGVDLPRVTRVMLLGAPRSLDRATQSAGRADHRPGAAVCASVLPCSATELLIACAVRNALQRNEFDAVELFDGDLDVAVQAAIGRVAIGPCSAAELARSLRSSAGFAALSLDDLDAVIDFLTTGGDAFAAYPELARLRADDGVYALSGRRSEIRYLRGIGTIVSDESVAVVHGERVVGELQGRFAGALEVGDRFILAGRVWRVTASGRGAVYVRPDPSRRRGVPAWSGSAASMSPGVAASLEQLIGELDLGDARDTREAPRSLAALLGVRVESARPVHRMLEAQRARGPLPSPSRFVIELISRSDHLDLIAHTFAGRAANEVIARVVASRLPRPAPSGADVAATDLSARVTVSWRGAPPTLDALRGWLRAEGLRDALFAALDGSSLAAASFREVARVSQLWLPDAKRGAVTPTLLFTVLTRHDPDHLLLRAQRHTLWRALEGPRAEERLARLATRDWHVIEGDVPTPLGVEVAASSPDLVRPEDPEAALADAAHALYLRALGADP